jgi:F420-non-reducing hydrogenase small subunit
MYWCASCGGCEESIIDLAEELLLILDKADIVFWPIAMDTKYSHVEALPDGDLAVTLINGAVRDKEQERMVRLLRRKSRLVMAHGSCAHLGGVVGLANFFSPASLIDRAYKEMPTLNDPETIPGPLSEVEGTVLELPEPLRRVAPLEQVIRVDYTIPGCPPPPNLVKDALLGALDKTLPEKGTVLAEARALCHSCPRLSSRPEKIRLKAFKRLQETTWDPEVCFLAQGLVCLGPATRGGCGARCIGANMPCRGCFGPLDNVSDQGLGSLSLLASLLDAPLEDELRDMVKRIPDLAGLLYRYNLAASTLSGRVE